MVIPGGDESPSTILDIVRNLRHAQMSTYPPKTARPGGGGRRTRRSQLLRNGVGEPICGQWVANFDDETWWRAQSILDDTERAINTSGSTR